MVLFYYFLTLLLFAKVARVSFLIASLFTVLCEWDFLLFPTLVDLFAIFFNFKNLVIYKNITYILIFYPNGFAVPRVSKCRCGPVLLPVFPVAPII